LPVEPEFRELIPIFLEESKERLERLTTLVPDLPDRTAVLEAKRELHTLKGAGRMMRLAAFAELSHAAEELLEIPGGAWIPLLERTLDHLSGMVEAIAGGGEPEAPAELLAALEQAKAAAAPQDPPATAPPAEPAPIPPLQSPSPFPTSPAPARPEPVPTAARPVSGAAEVRVDAASLDAVAERATQVRIMALATRQMVERVYELARLAEDGVREPQPTQVLAVLATMLRRVGVELEGGQRRLIRSAEDQLDTMLTLQLQPLRSSFQSLARYARDLARSLGREVAVALEGEETRLDRRIAREIEEALLHLVRNAVDHGIEATAVRQARGKPRQGKIAIRAIGSGDRVRLEIADDGGGIDPERVRERAVRLGLLDATVAAALSRAEVLRLLFLSGFSTREAVSEISGRGVGLDVVATAVARVGGEVYLDSDPQTGTVIALEVPVARRGEHVLLLRVGPQRLVIPSAAIRRATRIAAAFVVERDGRTFAQLGDRLVPFVPLARLYGQPALDSQILLEGVASGRPLALAVDTVEGEQEVLVRPLSAKVEGDRLLEGVALLASGEPVGVLSPAALGQRESLRTLPATTERIQRRRIRVLLVDDSLVTREMERRLLEDAGFQVAAAADAAEALARLGEESFDCVVTDIEMPGMDGFELTAQLRGMENFVHLPVIVVSTRDRPEDRLRGLKAGADAYLTKQSLDAGELVDLVQRLTGREA